MLASQEELCSMEGELTNRPQNKTFRSLRSVTIHKILVGQCQE
jgi:hypothetical protein